MLQAKQAFTQSFENLCLELLHQGYEAMLAAKSYQLDWKEDKLTVHYIAQMKTLRIRKENKITITPQYIIYSDEHAFGEDEVEEDPDVVMRENFEKNGFSLTYECIGLRRTIFDPYDSVAHFSRVGDFRRYFQNIPGLDEDIASEITFHIEELHPQLFDGFAAAARTLERAETAEDYAQAAISGRRLLEKVANYLYPPSNSLRNGKKVDSAAYLNRIWAYIEDTLSASGGDQIALNWLGKEADRLVKLFNTGLHADSGRQKVEAAFRDLMVWLSNVISLDPVAIRKSLTTYHFD